VVCAGCDGNVGGEDMALLTGAAIRDDMSVLSGCSVTLERRHVQVAERCDIKAVGCCDSSQLD
jgi:hypothetical protein